MDTEAHIIQIISMLSVWAMGANVEWITVGFTPDLETNWPVVFQLQV
jgi:hypothetical protein